MDEVHHGPFFEASLITLTTYAVLFGLRKIVHAYVEKRESDGKEIKIDYILLSMVDHTTQFFLIGSALFVGAQFYPLRAKYENWADKLYFIICMWQLAVWGNDLIHKWLDRTMSRRMKRDPSATTSISLVQFVAKAMLFIFIFLFTLHNLGVQITAMIAGLGVGGIAVALAVQNILGDLFSSLSIVLDKPFVVGDFIVLNDWMGTVERIGLKTTRLRSLSGEQIIISNSDLLGSRIRNYKRMFERRVVQNFSLSHQSSEDQIIWAVDVISEAIKKTPKVRLDRCHFSKITPTAYELEAVYWVMNPDHNFHMDLQQKLLLEILTSFRNSGIEMGYPTQNLSFSADDLFDRLQGEKVTSEKSLS